MPDGVSSIHVVATGAPGAVGISGGPAGRGAKVSGDLTVTSGQNLYVNVGGAPTGGTPTASELPVRWVQRWRVSSIFGGGGGGASDVRTDIQDRGGSLASRLIVAGGGGGSGRGSLMHDCFAHLLGVTAAMRDRTAAMVIRAVLSPEAPAGRRAPRAPAASGAAPVARTGRWGRAAPVANLQRWRWRRRLLRRWGRRGCTSGVVLALIIGPAGGGGGGSSLDPDGGSLPTIV